MVLELPPLKTYCGVDMRDNEFQLKAILKNDEHRASARLLMKQWGIGRQLKGTSANTIVVSYRDLQRFLECFKKHVKTSQYYRFVSLDETSPRYLAYKTIKETLEKYSDIRQPIAKIPRADYTKEWRAKKSAIYRAKINANEREVVLRDIMPNNTGVSLVIGTLKRMGYRPRVEANRYFISRDLLVFYLDEAQRIVRESGRYKGKTTGGHLDTIPLVKNFLAGAKNVR